MRARGRCLPQSAQSRSRLLALVLHPRGRSTFHRIHHVQFASQQRQGLSDDGYTSPRRQKWRAYQRTDTRGPGNYTPRPHRRAARARPQRVRFSTFSPFRPASATARSLRVHDPCSCFLLNICGMVGVEEHSHWVGDKLVPSIRVSHFIFRLNVSGRNTISQGWNTSKCIGLSAHIGEPTAVRYFTAPSRSLQPGKYRAWELYDDPHAQHDFQSHDCISAQTCKLHAARCSSVRIE